jgi:CheY-like chemotaxis protein
MKSDNIDVRSDCAPIKAGDSLQGKRKHAGTILFCEDEPSIRDMIVSHLMTMGYQVFAAASGEEALQLIQTQRVCPDLLVTDLRMPHIGGMLLAQRLQAVFPKMKIILMSGSPLEEYPEYQATDINLPFIAKPFSLSQLAAMIRMTLAD